VPSERLDLSKLDAAGKTAFYAWLGGVFDWDNLVIDTEELNPLPTTATLDRLAPWDFTKIFETGVVGDRLVEVVPAHIIYNDYNTNERIGSIGFFYASIFDVAGTPTSEYIYVVERKFERPFNTNYIPSLGVYQKQ
jgi:hypothetical protein